MDMLVENMDAYVGLSEPSWSYFENGHDAKVLGLFKMVDDGSPTGKMLIVTWYANLTEWEETRVVGEVDGKMWAERAKMEIKQFGAAARFRC
jgi:hypothetical protein